MAAYEVKLVDRSHNVMGLRPTEEDPDVLLIYHYPGGDIDTRMMDAHMMFAALYDLFQCYDELKDGDTFNTEFGIYHCMGVHVVPGFEMGADPRANQKDNVHY